MLWSFCVLLACQAVGEAVHAATGLPVPGTIIGMGLLLMLLARRPGPPRPPATLPAADALLPYLGLMFVPPGVLAVLRLAAIPEAWLPAAAAIAVSSALTLAVAGRLAQALLGRSPHAASGCLDVGGARGARR